MQYINMDKGWEYRPGFVDSVSMLGNIDCQIVDLPHDSMISQKTSADAPAKQDSGYFKGDICNYTKYITIPKEWENEKIGLKFDGVMMHTTIEVNGCMVGEHHYGYSPFYIDITDYVAFGEENRITINTNAGLQPSSRWYSGCGVIRSLSLCHSPKLHVKDDGIYVYTKEVSDGVAYLEAQIDICNETLENRLAEITLKMIDDENGNEVANVSRTIQINAVNEETARMSFVLKEAKLWNCDSPNLYQVKATATDLGTFRTHFIENAHKTTDEDTKLFGIRTITVDAIRGLRINNKSVKLKGGCIHHDNGLLGAISLFECEDRKIKKLKEIGFNAIRTAHNPPSEALIEACDRNGMFIFDEAFDAWGIAKRPGDFSTCFTKYWADELTAFIRRDRIHPSVIMWSTGNEIPERGGLNNGYTVATKLAEAIRTLDHSRPISNGICSFWSGLDDSLAKKQNSAQNAQNNEELSWDNLTDPFTNGLDVVGYNYMEDLYENSHKKYPNRVILGSENFPKEIGYRWPLVEALPYVIGEFTWTAWDYIGEAGIGKSIFVYPDDPLANCPPWEIMPQQTSPYPWRLANDADYDITGMMCPQGAYRSVVWGSNNTYLYSVHPGNLDKIEKMSMWGFIDVLKCWNYAEYVHKPAELVVFSNADEVAILINGQEIERKAVSKEKPLPNSVRFQTVYVPGTVEAVSYKAGIEVSRDKLETSEAPAKIVLRPEKNRLKADGHDLVYIAIDIVDCENKKVSDARVKLTAYVEGAGYLAGFGTGNPVTDEVYTDNRSETFNGSAMLITRSSYNVGKTIIKVVADEFDFSASCEIDIVE